MQVIWFSAHSSRLLEIAFCWAEARQSTVENFRHPGAQAPPNGPARPFYHPMTNSRPYIDLINAAGRLDQERPTQDAWQLVAPKYFPPKELVAPNANFFGHLGSHLEIPQANMRGI